MPNNRINYLLAVLSFFALPLLMVLLSKGVSSQLLGHRQALKAFEEGRMVYQDLDEGVLLARSFLMPNYDKLADSSQRGHQLCDQFRLALGLTEQINSTALSLKHAEFCKKMEEMISNVERFKLKNSVIYNSLKYLPTTMAQLKGIKNNEGMQELYIELLRYSLDQNPAGYQVALVKMDDLRARQGNNPRGPAAELLSHTAVVLAAIHERHILEGKIFADEVPHSLTQLNAEYLQEYERKDKVALGFRIALFTLTILFAGLLFALFARLQLTRDKLHRLNQNLELNVKLRTVELTEPCRN